MQSTFLPAIRFVALCLTVVLATMGISSPALAQPRPVVTLASNVQLMETEPSPLEGRTPVFLVHGIGGRETEHYKWDLFLAYLQQKAEFNRQYKVYLVEYDPGDSVSAISENLHATLTTFLAKHHKPHYRAIGFSEGGLVLRGVLQDPELFLLADKVITVASPFEGSPLANPKWLVSQMKENSRFSLIHLTHKVSYGVAQLKHPYFQQDFSFLEVAQAQSQAETQPSYSLERHPNFITYGSYFGVSVHQQQELFEALEVANPPQTPDITVKNPFSKHFFLRRVQVAFSKLPLGKVDQLREAMVRQLSQKRVKNPEDVLALAALEEELDRAPLPMLVYNDGISPISSSLWLSRFTGDGQAQGESLTQRNWAALRSVRNTNKVRLFHSMDHANWMEGQPLRQEATLRDLLNPLQSPKPVFDWFYADLTS